MMVGVAVGLVLGGLLGSRAPGMTPRARVVLAGLEGAVLLATAGGFAAIFLGLSNGYDNHGMHDFVLGATAGAIGGLILGGLLGSRPSRGERSSP
jgi:hypothetical protein